MSDGYGDELIIIRFEREYVAAKERIVEFSGCIEGSEEEAHLKALVSAVEGYEAERLLDDWAAHADGLVLGGIGVFPAIPDSWAVWEKVGDEWREVEPLIAASANGRTYRPGANPPYEFWARSRDEVIAEAKRLAILYRDDQTTKKGPPARS